MERRGNNSILNVSLGSRKIPMNSQNNSRSREKDRNMSILSKANSKSGINISYQQSNNKITKFNRNQVNSQSKILEDNILGDLTEYSNENSEENSREKEEEEENKESQESDGQIDFDIDGLNKSLREILENISDNEEDYIKGLERYYIHLQEKLQKLEHSEEEMIHNKQVLELQIDTMDEQINHLHSMIEQYLAENRKLKNMIKSEKSKNPNLQLQIEENDMIVDKIYSVIRYLDLTKLIKFQKHIMNRRTNTVDFEEATMALRTNAGEYLKRQASVLYFIHLLKMRYQVTKIVQDKTNSDSDKNKGTNLINYRDYDPGKLFENKIRVIFGGESYLVSMDSEENKDSYNILDLKNEICDIWNVPSDEREMYHIINDKFHVYSSKTLLYNVQKTFWNSLMSESKEDKENGIGGINNNNFFQNLLTLELIHKNFILNGRNSDISNYAAEKNKKENNATNQIDRTRRVMDVSTTEGNFSSSIEDYVLYLRQKEAFINFFKKDRIKEDLLKKHVERMEKINLKFDTKKKELEKKDAEDEELRENEVLREMEIKDEKEKIKNRLLEHNNKQDPIYFSTYDLFKYRLAKFWHFAFFLFIIAIFLIYYSNYGTLNKIQEYTLNNIMNDIFLFNPLYKNFLRNNAAYEQKDFSKLISTRNDLLIWLDIVFNNIIMSSTVSPDDTARMGVDGYSNYLQRDNTIYETFGSIRFSYKNTDPVKSKYNSTIFELPKNITENLNYFEEFKVSNEETSYKIFENSEGSYTFNENIQENDKFICNGCISNAKFQYNSDKNRSMHFISGGFGDYEGGSFQYYLNAFEIHRSDFSSILKFIKEDSIVFPQCRMLKIDINILNISLRSIIKIALLFEFSTIGDIQAKVETDVYDTKLKLSFLANFIGLLYYVIFAIIGLGVILNLFTYKLISEKAKKINYLPTICEIAIICLLIIEFFLNSQEQVLYNETIGSDLDLDKSIYVENYTGIDKWKYYDFTNLINLIKIQQTIRGGIIILLFFRIVICFVSSPLIKYIMVLFLKTTVSIFNIMVFLFIFIFSFSLIFHVILGRNVQIYSSLSNTFLLTLTSLLGRLQIRDTKYMTTIHYFIIVIFFIIIKFIIFTFLYGVIKETFEVVRKEYNEYVEKPHFKYVGENFNLFLKYLLFPISFYFMIRDFMRIKRKYKNFGKLEAFVKEDNNRKFYLIHFLF